MSSDHSAAASATHDEPANLLWQQYREAVDGLGALPQVVANRHLQVGTRGDGDLKAQRRNLEEQLAQAQQWRRLAERALSNAQARLVAAKVLIPDVSSPNFALSHDGVMPTELVERLRQAVTDVDADVAAVRTARRRMVDERARGEVAQRAVAQRRRRRNSVAAMAALVAVLLLVILLM